MFFQLSGNELISILISDGRTYTLRVDLTDYNGNSVFAKYGYVSLDDESHCYKLHIAGYNSTSTACRCNYVKYIYISIYLSIDLSFCYCSRRSATFYNVYINTYITRLKIHELYAITKWHG